MVNVIKIHRYSALTALAILLLLSVSGFFLDHRNWDFLYTTTFKNVPKNIIQMDKNLFKFYWQDPTKKSHFLIAGNRGIYQTIDNGKNFEKIFNYQVLGFVKNLKNLYIATSDGIKEFKNGKIINIALKGKYVNALSGYNNILFASTNKNRLYKIDKNNAIVIAKTKLYIPKDQLQENITLSRFVRDLHYGRGLFIAPWSQLLDDFSAIYLFWLSVSGFLIWWLIKKKKGRLNRKIIKLHSITFVFIVIFPLIILSLTGIILDHAGFLNKYMKNIILKHSFLPPVYSSLKGDIWSVDFDGNLYRVGNRYGIYKSTNLKQWKLENRGFAYKMIRTGNILYVSGMGSPNRIYQNGKWKILANTPHMFSDIITRKGNKIIFFKLQNLKNKIPDTNNATLFTVLLSLHNGKFFTSSWIWINDISAILLMTLLTTGFLRYKKRFSTTL
jgi:hypothetical protein